jgi:hypothetical protein
MAFKNVRFSFDIPMEDIMALAIQRGVGLNIEVESKEPKKPRQLRNVDPAPKLLEGPKKERGAQANILRRLFVEKGAGVIVTTAECKDAFVANGLEGPRAYQSLNQIKNDDAIESVGKGEWKASKKGVEAMKALLSKQTEAVANG